jgi:hypothetical protein
MNNQSKSFKYIKGFIIDIKRQCLQLNIFSSIDFWRLLCLFLIETSFALPKVDRRSPIFILYLPLSVGNFHFFFFHSLPQCFLTCPSVYRFFLLALSQTLDFCS